MEGIPFPTETKSKLDTILKSIKTNTHNLIYNLPTRTLELKEKIKTIQTKLCNNNYCDIIAIFNIPDHDCDCFGTNSNFPITELTNTIYPILVEIISISTDIVTYLELHQTSKEIQSSDNFKRDVIDEISNFVIANAKVTAKSLVTESSKYYQTRASILSKVLKYPHNFDYQNTIRLIDFSHFHTLKRILNSDIMYIYTLLFDMLSKNISNIRDNADASSNNNDINNYSEKSCNSSLFI